MEDPTRLGNNRTGIQRSPLHDELLLEESAQQRPAEQLTIKNQPENLLMAELRREYVNEAEALGSMPAPSTWRGALESGANALLGRRMQVLMDKIAERLAYERGGTRLYDAALVKVIALAEGTPVSVQRVKQIRDQEIEHAALLQEALTTLGADPTAQTPCADLVGIQSAGLMQAVTDPRTSLVQTLSSLLAAELIDVASWEMLSRMARSLGQDDIADRFDHALVQETQHLESVSRWYETLTMEEARPLS